MTNPRIHRRQAGFTLVELLVVIAIIGVLIGLLLEGKKAEQAAQSAYATAEERTLRQLGLTASGCLSDADATLQPLYTELATAQATNGTVDHEGLPRHRDALRVHRDCVGGILEALRELYPRLDRGDRRLARELRQPLESMVVELERAARLLDGLLIPPEPVHPPEPV
jgi:prepilin-type N-terminal cleavage/methylation domain-containing protein